MAEIHETAFECVSTDNTATFFSSERTWIARILKLAKKYPLDVRIVAQNEDGSVVVHLPKKWLKVSPPRKDNLTSEQKAALAERMRKMREEKAE